MRRASLTKEISGRRELIIFMICFLGASGLGATVTILHQAPASELLAQLPMVLLVSVILYGSTAFLRFFYHLIAKLWHR